MQTTIHANDAPTVLVVFGVTGDLAKKKIIPSLWYLYNEGRLPEHLAVIGIARRDMDDAAWRQYINDVVSARDENAIDAAAFAAFCDRFTYLAGDTVDQETFQTLKQAIDQIEHEWQTHANKLFYLSVPPDTYNDVFAGLAYVDLNESHDDESGWSRLLIEKPFGADLASAEQLQECVTSYFTEEQIYRIDHYLFKEIVQGIESFRFSNNLFEHSWDNASIERIDIRLDESIGVEDRGNFYESVGALRDVGQNHMLAMLAAITMEYPRDDAPSTIRTNRAEILNTLAPWTDTSVARDTFRAQYAGYQDIDGVRPASDTETYFALRTELTHPKWSGVPIYMEAGKRLGTARKEIVLTLTHPDVCHLCEVGEHGPNRIVFRLEPNDEIVIHFWTKKPGFEHALEERTFSFFLYEKRAKVQYVEEYAKVLYAAMRGEQRLFVSYEEVKAAWRFTDPVVTRWQQNTPHLATYEKDMKPEPELLTRQVWQTGQAHTSNRGSLGMIGLGKMGANLSRQLHEKGWQVVGFNKTPDATQQLAGEGLTAAYDLRELVNALPQPRTVWIMVPYTAVDDVLSELVPFLDTGDVVIDGGNSPYKDSMRRGEELSERGIRFLDVGVSGGPDGARHGACLMVGGDRELYTEYASLFRDLAVSNGYGYMGAHGAGHFVKMVHNGIEYGMMQALGEGFAIMKTAPFSLDLPEIARVYANGSVIESRLVEWLADTYATYGAELDADECCSGSVGHSGEGAWTVETARELGVPVSIIEGALDFRIRSENDPSYTGRVLSALRHQFGGHDASRNDQNKKDDAS